MINRRDFIGNIGLLFSASIFTPHIIRPTWRDTLKYHNPFEPHWAVMKEEWFAAFAVDQGYRHLYEKHPHTRIQAQEQYDRIVCSKVIVTPDYVYIREPWYEQMMPEMKTPNGVLVKPYQHLPKSFVPPHVQT